MRATRTFTDKTGVMRKNGEEWLIKMEDTEAHIPDVYEEASQEAVYTSRLSLIVQDCSEAIKFTLRLWLQHWLDIVQTKCWHVFVSCS